jgi:hypothetical protein
MLRTTPAKEAAMPIVNGGKPHGDDNTNTNTTTTLGEDTAHWVRDDNGDWTWVRSGVPDASQLQDWGWATLTDITQNPNGDMNIGYWAPQHGGGYSWVWGAEPPEGLRDTPGITNPNHVPGGHDGDRTGVTTIPRDVQVPTLDDSWDGRPPDVTGDVDLDPNVPPGTVETPPDHPPFAVSPGAIRDAETVLTTQIDSAISDYDSMVAAVEAAKTQNLYHGNKPEVTHTSDQLLLAVADAIHLAGQFTQSLNQSAQMYARADLDSFME